MDVSGNSFTEVLSEVSRESGLDEAEKSIAFLAIEDTAPVFLLPFMPSRSFVRRIRSSFDE